MQQLKHTIIFGKLRMNRLFLHTQMIGGKLFLPIRHTFQLHPQKVWTIWNVCLFLCQKIILNTILLTTPLREVTVLSLWYLMDNFMGLLINKKTFAYNTVKQTTDNRNQNQTLLLAFCHKLDTIITGAHYWVKRFTSFDHTDHTMWSM